MTEQESKDLAEQLGRRFAAHVDVEEVAAGRFRFTVLSRGFAGVSHLRRQDDAWAFVDSIASREQSLDISLLLTLSPEDVDDSLVALMP